MLYVGGKVIGMLFFVIVLLGVKFGMCVFDEEIFGFVVVIVEYFIDVEVVELVNVLEFGLVGLVIGVDVDCVKVIVMQLKVGYFYINDQMVVVLLFVLFGGCGWFGNGICIFGFVIWEEFI